MRPQSLIDLPLASISVFSSLVRRGKRLLCVCEAVCICLCSYLHHHHYLFAHTSKCHNIFLANVFLLTWSVDARVCGQDSPLHFCVCVSVCVRLCMCCVQSSKPCVCVCDQITMEASLTELSAVPETALRGPALSLGVDKRTIFKGRRGKTARPCQGRRNSPLTPWASPLKRFKEQAGKREGMEGKRVDGISLRIHDMLIVWSQMYWSCEGFSFRLKVLYATYFHILILH